MAKARTGRVDVYPNRAMFSVLMSAANTLTFQQIRFGMGIFAGTALIISKIEWFILAPIAELIAAADSIRIAMTNRDDLAAIDADNMNVLVLKVMNMMSSGTPANAALFEQPLVSDYSTLPGGGLIVPANPMFIALTSVGLTTAAEVDAIMYYTTKTLADADYIELVQSLIPVNI